MFIQDKEKRWTTFTGSPPLQPGDRVRVKLSIESKTPRTYVHIHDPRAAAFEPADISCYKHFNDFGRNESVSYNGMDIFAEEIPRGISELFYEITAVLEGKFSADLQRWSACICPPRQLVVILLSWSLANNEKIKK